MPKSARSSASSLQNRARDSWWARPQAHGVTALAAFLAGGLCVWAAMRNPPQPPAAAPLPGLAASAPATPAIGQSPAEAALKLGNAAYDQGRWIDAASQYQAAIAGGIDNPDVRTDLGNCFRFGGDPQKALEQYRIAQRQNPRHEHSLFNTVTLYVEVLHDTPKALEFWREYLKRFPESANSPMVQRFLADHPEMAASAPAAIPAVPVPNRPPEQSAAMADWMKREQGGQNAAPK